MSALDRLFSRAGELTAAIGVGQDYYRRLAEVESTFRPNAQNPGSSAGGLFQFIDSTWGQYGEGGNRFAPADNLNPITNLTRDNFNALRNALGRNPTQGELYLAHQQGAGGAIDLLSNPTGLAVETVGYDAVVLNKGDPAMTNQDFAGLWTGEFADGQLSDAPVPGERSGGIFGAVTDFFTRGSVVLLGLIFVGVGLMLFKPTRTIITQAAPVKGAVKAAQVAADAV